MSEGRFNDFLPPGSDTMGGGRPVSRPAPEGRTPVQEEPASSSAGGAVSENTEDAVPQVPLITPEGEALDEWLDRLLSTEEHVRKSGTAYAISDHSDRKLRQIKYAIDDLGRYKKRKTGLGNLQELGIELLYQAVVERGVLHRFDAVFADEDPR